ncbi:MAG TPA: hypothetical protein DCM86_04970 [Verrucomicrobiales bacterium]|nr:hypothetical protein [Verrucomicrobiales bacterium]
MFLPFLLSLLTLISPVRAEPLENSPMPTPWVWTKDVWADGGYQDNVLFSHDAREASPFARVGAELGFLRAGTERFHFQGAVSFEEKRFTSAETVDHERFASANAEASYDLGRDWRLSLAGRYGYQDQVTDASITDTNLASFPVQSHTFELRPSARVGLRPGWWMELGAMVTRQRYLQGELDDYWEFGPRVQVGHEYGHRSELTAEVAVASRAYDERVRFTAAGDPLPGEPLTYRIPSVTLQARHFWDTARHWRTLTKLTAEKVEDNGSGFFSYERLGLVQQVRYRTARWEIKGQVQLTRYRYARQRDDAGTAPRERDLVRGNLHVERSLGRYLNVHGDYECERSFSNTQIDSYLANTVSLGLGVEF